MTRHIGAAIPDKTKMKIVPTPSPLWLYNLWRYKPEVNAGNTQRAHRPALPQEKACLKHNPHERKKDTASCKRAAPRHAAHAVPGRQRPRRWLSRQPRSPFQRVPSLPLQGELLALPSFFSMRSTKADMHLQHRLPSPHQLILQIRSQFC